MPQLSAVQQAMLAEIQKTHPDVTAELFQSVRPEVQHELVKEWLDKQTGVATDAQGHAAPPPERSAVQQVVEGVKDVGRSVKGVAKAAGAMQNPMGAGNLDIVENAGRGIGNAAKGAAGTLAGTFLQPTPSDSAWYKNGGVDATMAKTGLAPNLGPTQSEDEFRRAAMKTAGAASMSTAYLPAVVAGGMMQNPDEPYRGGTTAGIMGSAPYVATGAARGAQAIRELGPQAQAAARLRTVMENQANGPAATDAAQRIAINLGKRDIMPMAATSPEAGAEGEWVLSNLAKKRAEQEAANARITSQQTGRSVGDLKTTRGPVPIPEERVAELAKERSGWAKGPEGFGGIRSANPTVDVAPVEKFFQQPIVRDALRDATKAGLIGEPLDVAAVGRSQFEQTVADATEAQAAWDERAKMFANKSGYKNPQGEFVPGDGSVDMVKAEKVLGPRPDVPTAPPAPSAEMLMHIREQLKAAIERGYAPNSGNGGVAARLQEVLNGLDEHMKTVIPGYAEATSEYGLRKGAEGAIAKPIGGREHLGRIPSAEEVWQPGFNGKRVREIVHQLSNEPFEVSQRAGNTSALKEFQDALAAHLEQDLRSGRLAAKDLTPEALASNPDLGDKIRAAMPNETMRNEFIARAKVEAMRGENLRVPAAGAKPPIATQSWFSKYLPAKLAYKFGGKKYLEKIAGAEHDFLFTPGKAFPYTPKPAIAPTSTAAQRAAALAAMLSAQQKDSTP